MKVNSLLMKTALAAAVASVSFGASAATFDLGVAAPTTVANEVFGPNSDTTVIQLPIITFDASATGANGDLAGVTSVAGLSTIKLTLGGDAIFGEVYDDPADWAAQNIVVNVGGTVLDNTTATVSAGGTNNDNQITITLLTAGLALDDITLSGFKVQQLRTTLERQGSRNVQTLLASLEVREDSSVATSALDNAGPNVVIQSIDGVILSGNPTGYTAANPGRARINVADGQLLFTTATGVASAADFTSPGVNAINLGTLTVDRNNQGYIAAAARPAGKEDGTLFDFTGGDEISLVLSSVGGVDLRPFGNFTLQDTTSGSYVAACDGTAVVGTALATAASPAEVDVNFTTTSILGRTLQLCATKPAANTAVMPEVTLSAELNVDYFSARYTDSRDVLDLGRIQRNGCQVTLFNLPNVNAADNAFIRFSNTSELEGQVNAYVWTQDGQRVDVGAEVLDNLPAHATAVFHTNEGQTSGVYLGDVLPEFAATDGRSRLVLQGAFPSCEALGLVRSDNGTLVNMTSTTYSDGVNGLQENGTSNTGN